MVQLPASALLTNALGKLTVPLSLPIVAPRRRSWPLKGVESSGLADIALLTENSPNPLPFSWTRPSPLQRIGPLKEFVPGLPNRLQRMLRDDDVLVHLMVVVPGKDIPPASKSRVPAVPTVALMITVGELPAAGALERISEPALRDIKPLMVFAPNTLIVPANALVNVPAPLKLPVRAKCPCG